MRSMWRLVVLAPVVAGLMVMGSSAFAQPGGRGGGGFGGGNNTGLDLLRDENVRKELDLEEGQLTKLQDLAGKMQEEVRAQFQGFDFAALRELSEEDRDARMAEVREKVAKVTADMQKQIDEVLLPRQRERLKQIVVQSQMRRQGASGAITSGTLAEQLGITEEQKEKLAEKQREIEAETRAKIEKIRQDAQDDLLSVLTPTQQAKLKQMIGEPITFAPTQFGQGGPGGAGGQRGGPGGRGGDAGGGRGRGGDRGGDNGGRNN